MSLILHIVWKKTALRFMVISGIIIILLGIIDLELSSIQLGIIVIYFAFVGAAINSCVCRLGEHEARLKKLERKK